MNVETLSAIFVKGTGMFSRQFTAIDNNSMTIAVATNWIIVEHLIIKRLNMCSKVCGSLRNNK